ncbi:MAG TPA: sporulation protein YabP [Clostridiaceae bacterium]
MEIKKDSKFEDKKSNLTLESRKKLSLSGVLEVLSFNDNQIVLNTNLGELIIKGKELKINKLDVQNGDIIMVGIIGSFIYSGKEEKAKVNESILQRLFR